MKYPCLHELIRLIACDNNISMRPDPVWPDSCDKLEEKASTLKPSESELLACGERSEAETLIGEKGLDELDDFLNEVFDGRYYENFYIIHGKRGLQHE